MKKITIIILIVMFCIILPLSLRKRDSFEVLKLVSAKEFYVDLNGNKVCDEDELIIIEAFDDGLSDIESAQINYLGLEFAKKNLLNNAVKIDHSKDGEVIVLLSDGRNYKKLLEENGFILSKENTAKVKQNIEYASALNLLSYNKLSHNYHELTCKYALKSQNVVIMKKTDLPKSAIPCKVCHVQKNKVFKQKITKENKYPRDVYEKYEPIYKDSSVEFYVTDFTKYYYPSNKCLTTPCKSLLKQINNAKKTIDFAIYGVDSQPEITNALINAQKRGVNVRWIYDLDYKGKTIYMETFRLKKSLGNARADTDYAEEFASVKVKDGIMHNKFFIFDSKVLWTGSANISHTDLSGFNANSVLLINSSAIAQIYTKEFEQMYLGKFHSVKEPTLPNKIHAGNSQIETYFSPQDNAISDHIVPLINSAKKYIYVPVFVITHKSFNEALINAKKRGVDVKIIVDATAAGAKYSSVKLLRESGLPVKVENRAGKMHMKSLIIDDNYVVVGSMNFTKSGEKYNDENVLIITNPQMAKAFKLKFLYFWQEIPDKWLLKNPGAESWNSINSCFDGVDNDFDGKIDMLDEGCNFVRNKKQPDTNSKKAF